MDVVSVVAGLALIGLVLRDIFDTLFHPHGNGILSERLARSVWALVRRPARRRRSLLTVAGPVAFLMVIVSWVTLMVLGGALIIEPAMPESYSAIPGQDRPEGFGDAVYTSFVNLTSLGYGDFVPTTLGLKLLGPTQAAMGLGILSAAISWILSVYAVLRTSRSTAREIDLIADSGALDPADLPAITSKLVDLDIELRQFPIAYYFPSIDRRREIALALDRLLELVEAAPLDGTPQAHRAEAAADGLLAAVNDRFLGGAGTTEEEIMALWRADHLWD